MFELSNILVGMLSICDNIIVNVNTIVINFCFIGTPYLYNKFNIYSLIIQFAFDNNKGIENKYIIQIVSTYPAENLQNDSKDPKIQKQIIVAIIMFLLSQLLCFTICNTAIKKVKNIINPDIPKLTNVSIYML